MDAPDRLVDLRSDTLTRPSPPMRAAMAAADVGDDVLGEDPCVLALEEETAGRFGMAAALFVPSGTMGNQLGVRLLVAPGEELLCDADAHLVSYEGGGAAVHAGIQTRTLVSRRGLLDPVAVAGQLRDAEYGTVPTRAVAVEQTHNRGGGAVYPLEALQRLRAVTRDAGVALHGDGARIFNAHVASGITLEQFGALFDTLSVCLSKGLGAPVGSVLLLADAAQREPARRMRRRLGGGMRQAGVLAAAGRYALDHNVERLAEDHRRARAIADRLADTGTVDPGEVETNIVPLDLTASRLDARTVARRAEEQGVRVSVVEPHRLRLVTHLDVDDAGCAHATEVLGRLLS